MEKDLYQPTSEGGLISKIHKELKKLDIKKPKKSDLKMGYRSKQRILNRGILIGQETFKEVVNILSVVV